MVVGCGALGNEVIKNLALIGVGNIVIVDFDNVEQHNLSRSVLFSKKEEAVGIPKVNVIAEAVRKINPELNLRVINGDICADVGLGLIRTMDVLISCVDNRWARYSINRLCMRAGIPWIDAGISELEGTVRIFEPEKNCYACALSADDMAQMKKRFSCAGNIKRALKTESAPTTCIIASIIGGVQTQEALKLIHNKYSESEKFETLSGKMFVYDGKHLTTSTVRFEIYDDDCSLHQQWLPVSKSDISENTIIRDALFQIKKQLSVGDPYLILINDCFVDYIFDKETDKKYRVMMPGRKVEEFIKYSPELGKKPVSSYYQNEIYEFHLDSPYLEMTLNEIGIPNQDVIKVRCVSDGSFSEKDFFIEMK